MGLILASASPRRQELLRLITNDFTVFPAAVDESLPPALSVDNAAQYLARKKAAAVSSAFPDDIVLGSDTTVIIDHTILGKPGTPERAEEMMRRLSGKTHTVITGVALAKGKEMLSFQTSTDVTFYPLTEKQIQDYIATNEPMDKAGGYGIQGYGALLVQKICGDFYSVVGLPIGKIPKTINPAANRNNRKQKKSERNNHEQKRTL